MAVNYERTSYASLPSEFHGEGAIGQDEPSAAWFEHHRSIGPTQPDGQHPIAVDRSASADGRAGGFSRWVMRRLSVRHGHVAGYQWRGLLPLDGATRNQQRQNETDV